MSTFFAVRYMGLEHPLNPEPTKKRYHELARKYHPDKGGSTDQFQKLEQAYTAVKNVREQPPVQMAMYQEPTGWYMEEKDETGELDDNYSWIH